MDGIEGAAVIATTSAAADSLVSLRAIHRVRAKPPDAHRNRNLTMTGKATPSSPPSSPAKAGIQ